MITDLLYLIAIIFLNAILAVFSLINFILPHQISDALTYFLGLLNYFGGVFPVQDLYLSLFTLASAYILIYKIHIFFWIFSTLPIIGRYIKLPMKGENREYPTIDLRKRDGTIDLRRRK